MSELNRKLRWLIAIRLLIMVSITVPYFLYRASVPVDPAEATATIQLPATAMLPEDSPLRLLVAVTSVQTLLYVAFLRLLQKRPTTHAYLQFCGDLLLVTLLINRLGGPFSLLYLVIISVASVLLRRSAGLTVATLAFALHTVGVFAPFLAQTGFPERWIEYLTPAGERLTGVPPIYSLTVHLIGFYGVAFLTSYLARDVARAEARLRARNLDLASLKVVHRDVIESISSGLVTTDLEGNVTSVNRSGEEILGRSAAELIGLHITESGLFSPVEWRENTGRIGDGFLRSESERRGNGNGSFVGFTLTHLHDGEGTHRGYILVMQDFTERRKMQAELRIKDRMAAIGEMAAGLAHEIGNPLTAIAGSVQVLTGSLSGDVSQHKLLEIILKESQRLDRTVKAFLQLASSREHRPVEFDVAALLAEDVELLRNSEEVQEKHRIEAVLEPRSAIIRGDPDQIGQVFWNLTRNALQAMPESGKLLVTGHLDDAVYRMQFHDTGSGMTEEERTKMFQPFKSFFDQGMGIGMAIVYRIVEEHGGTIRADSDPGAGTVISVELPVGGGRQPWSEESA